MIEDFAKLIPASQKDRSGKVFYSGRRSFESQSDIYVLGINPGGDPRDHPDETVKSHTQWVVEKSPEDWSAYRDESWSGQQPGGDDLQQSLLHLFKGLNINPGEVPSSNLFFVRSAELEKLDGDENSMASQCWDFHKTVIDELNVRVIVCFGRFAGNFVRRRLHTFKNYDDKFVNGHGWSSFTYKTLTGLTVVDLSHPSRGAFWVKQGYDPTDLVLKALD